jgi:hypothetical protein
MKAILTSFFLLPFMLTAQDFPKKQVTTLPMKLTL